MKIITEKQIYNIVETILNESENIKGVNVEDALKGYLMAALWTSLRDGGGDSDHENYGEHLDAHYSWYEFDDESKNKVRGFIRKHLELSNDVWIENYMNNRQSHDGSSISEMYGHDLFLTQAGHGVGFWDRSEIDYGDELSEIAKDKIGWVESAYENGDEVILQ